MDAHSTRQSFHVSEASIFCTMCSICVISSHHREFASSVMKERKKSGMPKFFTIASKSCTWDLYHRGDLSMYEGRLYFVTCCNTSVSFMLGWTCFVCLISLSKHVCKITFKNYTDWRMSYMYNKYGLYGVKEENNVLMRYFEYSDNVVRP
jgi:hypothetical protein